MQWLALNQLWFLLIIPIILLLYLLKRKYENFEVSSTLLWARFLQNREANRPWQKLRRNLLLALQLLVASLLIIALLKPALLVEGNFAAHAVLVLDSSGSMLANEEGKTRFERAKAEIEAVINRLGSDQTLTLIEAGPEPVIHVSQSANAEELKQVLRQLTARPGAADYQGAFSLAKAIADQDEESGVMWFGDGDNGRLLSRPEFLVFDPERFRHIQVAKTKRNTVLGTFVTQQGPEGVEGLIRIDHYGSEEARGKVTVYDAQEQMIDSFKFTVREGEGYPITLDGLPSSPYFRAELTVDGDGLSEDNLLWSVPYQREQVRAAFVSPEGNRFLTQAVSLQPHIHLEHMSALPETRGDEQINQVDLWIFEGIVPREWPEGNVLLIDPQETNAWLAPSKKKEITDEIRVTEPDHPLLRHVNWNDVYISQAKSFADLEGVTPLVKAGDQELVSAGQIDGQRVVILGFDFRQSDFPLRSAFPIFMSNVVTWLSPAQSLPIGQGYPGETLSIPFYHASDKRVLIKPDGAQIELSKNGSTVLYQLPEQLGLYQVEEYRGETKETRYFTVQMRESESKIAPVAIHVSYGVDVTDEEELEAEGAGSTESRENDRQIVYHPLVFWFALGALLLAFVEWGVYQRGY